MVSVLVASTLTITPSTGRAALANEETIKAYAGCLAAAIQLKTLARMKGVEGTEIYSNMVDKLSNRYFGQAGTPEEFNYLSRIANEFVEAYRFLGHIETMRKADAFVQSRDCLALAFR